jgi:hypothetical protein
MKKTLHFSFTILYIIVTKIFTINPTAIDKFIIIIVNPNAFKIIITITILYIINYIVFN